MGFFEGFVNGLTGNNVKKTLNTYKEEDEDYLVNQADGKTNPYRKVAFENSSSRSNKYQCIRCKKWFEKGDIDIDHIIPQSKGGDSTRYNLQCMCKSCNRSKKDSMEDTRVDLIRRKKELDKQDKEDIEFLKIVSKKEDK